MDEAIPEEDQEIEEPQEPIDPPQEKNPHKRYIERGKEPSPAPVM